MRLRPSVRLRLTVLYGGLFLAAGALLLGVNYGLVRSRLPSDPSLVRAFPPPSAGHLPPPGPHGPAADVVVPVELDSPEGRRLRETLEEEVRDFRRRTLETLVVQSAIALGVMAMASIGLGWVVAGRVLSPLHRITATARRLSEQNLHERIDLDGPDDELKELADTFDGMLARLAAAFDAQGRFIANASHELRTPLSIQRALVDVELAGPGRSPEDLAVAARLRDAIGRSERLIDSLLLLARSDRGIEERSAVALDRAVVEVLAAAEQEAAARALRVERRLDPAVAGGDPALLERVVSNLVENAIRHNVDGGWLRVETRSEDGQAVVVVANTGAEIRPDEIGRLFEPFRRLQGDRTRSAQGSGLGLSIVRSVLEAHGGEVRAEPRQGGGLVVEVRLPGPPAGASPAGGCPEQR